MVASSIVCINVLLFIKMISWILFNLGLLVRWQDLFSALLVCLGLSIDFSKSELHLAKCFCLLSLFGIQWICTSMLIDKLLET